MIPRCCFKCNPYTYPFTDEWNIHVLSGVKIRRAPERPWFGSKERVLDLISAAEGRLAKVSAGSKVEVDVEIKDGDASHVVALSALKKKLRTSAKELRADGRSLDVNGSVVARVELEWGRWGIGYTVTSADADWVDITTLELAEEIRDSQSRWLRASTLAIRLLACLVGLADAAGLGLLVAYALREATGGSPSVAWGAAVAVAAWIAFVAGALALPLFAVTREDSKGLYLWFLQLLVLSLAGGGALQVLINLAA
ncbi:hypothetical protein AB0M02_10535 [Actinoplanes sp. NPDC051861]|uniref:hypothetical protein n=1 Tax=Actinoplanes sp. NPDC051861 TaxID=3155170 RepID=UPI00343EF9A8